MFINSGMISDIQFNKIKITDSKSLNENGGVIYLSSNYDGSLNITSGVF
jgi:hypothetical protein